MVRAVIFDWDGTLVDTAEASYRCYVRLFDELGVAFDREAYARTYSPNWYHTFRQLGLPEERWPHADTLYLVSALRQLVGYPGVEIAVASARGALDELASHGIDAAIVTSGSRERVTREIRSHGLADVIRECVCGSDVAQKKPHPAALHLTAVYHNLLRRWADA